MNRFKEGLFAASVFTIGAIGFSCGDSQKDSPSPTPIVTNLETPPPSITSTPQETIAHEQPYASIPPVPPESQGSAEEILGFWKEKRLEGNRPKLVANEFYEMDVNGPPGYPEYTPGPGSTTVFVKAGSVETAFGIRRQACEDILEAGGPEAAKIVVHFNIIVPNAGVDPFSEIGLTVQQKDKFLTPTTCEATS